MSEKTTSWLANHGIVENRYGLRQEPLVSRVLKGVRETFSFRKVVTLAALASMLSACMPQPGTEQQPELVPTYGPGDDIAEQIANDVANQFIDNHNAGEIAESEAVDAEAVVIGNAWEVDLVPGESEGFHIDGKDDLLIIYLQPGQEIFFTATNILFKSDAQGNINSEDTSGEYGQYPANTQVTLSGGPNGQTFYLRAGGSEGTVIQFGANEATHAIMSWGR